MQQLFGTITTSVRFQFTRIYVLYTSVQARRLRREERRGLLVGRRDIAEHRVPKLWVG